MEEPTPRARIYQLTSGFVMEIDGKMHAYPTIPALKRGVGTEIVKRVPRTSARVAPSGIPQAEPASPTQATEPEKLQVQLFNFGRVMSDIQNLSLADFERALAQYFPDIERIDWAASYIAEAKLMLSQRPLAAPPAPAPAPTVPEVDPRAQARREARAAAEARLLGAQVNAAGTPWVHDFCGRTSDCVLNDAAGGVTPLRDPICDRCQACMDDECSPREVDEPVDFLDEAMPPEVEAEEDIFTEPPAIILNEKGERIGRIQPGEPTTYATV